MLRPSAALLVLALAAGCGGGSSERPLPDVDPPRTAEAPPTSGDGIDPGWLREAARRAEVPERALEGYASAALAVAAVEPDCRLGWNTIAAIGRVESVHGAVGGARVGADGVAAPDIVGIALDGSPGVRAIDDTDGGSLDGDTRWDRAVGPLQFLPQTWRRWGADGDGDGVADPHDLDDAALATARYLCASGGGALERDDGWTRAVLTYNNSADYAREVAREADRYADAVERG